MNARAIIEWTQKGGAVFIKGSTFAFTYIGQQNMQNQVGHSIKTVFVNQESTVYKGNSTASLTGGTTLFHPSYNSSSLHGLILTPMFYRPRHRH